MRVSVFEKSDGMAGEVTGNCQCLWGYPVINENGECTCGPRPVNGGGGDGTEPPLGPPELMCADGYERVVLADGSQICVPVGAPKTLNTTPIKPLIRTGNGGPWQYSPLGGTSILNTDKRAKAAAASGDGTIFGFSPLLVLGAAAVGLYFLSSMTETKGGK